MKMSAATTLSVACFRVEFLVNKDGGKSNREFVSCLSFVKLSVIFNARGPSQTLSGSEKKIRFYDFDIAISQSGHCSKNLAEMSE